jgi:hypothetical protein
MPTRSRPERAALAFSALSAPQAEVISSKFGLVERSRMRETLAMVRNADDRERFDALKQLIAEVNAPVKFPPPASHDEGTCVFRQLEQYVARDLAKALALLGAMDRMLVAVALCHFSTEYRDDVWKALPGNLRISIRSVLGQVPTINHARTRRYATDLARRVAFDHGGPSAIAQ